MVVLLLLTVLAVRDVVTVAMPRIQNNYYPSTHFDVCVIFTPLQARLAQGVNSVTAELEGVEKLSDQVWG